MTTPLPNGNPRIVVVTGAAAGIGLATAQAFAEAGDTVVLTDLDLASAEARATALGDRHVGLSMDVSDDVAVERTIQAVAAHFGRIDVLINNAGIVDPNATKVFDKPMDEVRRLIAVNLEGSYAAARAAARIMRGQGDGTIVNLSSGAALSALPGRTPYSMTKAGVLGMTDALARAWAPDGVRVNAVLPGYVRTEILASLERAGKFDPSVAGAAVPLGRMAEPAEIAAAIRYLASAAVTTGTALLVDGGVAAYGGRAAASTAPVSGRVGAGLVLVAGGARGMGAAIADRYVAAGMRVVVVDDDAAAIAAIPADRAGLLLDMTDEAATERAIQDLATGQPIATLVTSIGSSGVTADETPADFHAGFERALTGPMTMARAVAATMSRRSAGGAIVTVAAEGGDAPAASGAAAREAMVMLTRSLACEWAVHGIRVNSVSPRAAGATEEVVRAVRFLTSDAASYVTGIDHVVGGIGGVRPSTG